MLTGIVNYDDFEYVVERKQQEKICFGSGLEKSTDPIKGVKRTLISPCYYNIQSGTSQFLNRITSKKGVGSMVNGAPRFTYKILTQIPSCTKYNIAMKWPEQKEGAAPFGFRTGRKPLFYSNTPGPGTYNIDSKQCRKTRFNYNFGKPTMIQTVEEFCIPDPVDTCIKCKELCKGDYWHHDHNTFLCQLCMDEEHKLHEMYSKKELKVFKKIRNCEYMHQHEGTTAAIKILPKQKVLKKKQIENYLDLFITCY